MNINEKIGELLAEIEAKTKQLIDKNAEVAKIRSERNDMVAALAGVLREKYDPLIGHVVQVSGKGFFCENREAEGILASEAFTVCGGRIMPALCKIKKDGTASKNRVPDWSLPEVNESFTIKLKHHD